MWEWNGNNYIRQLKSNNWKDIVSIYVVELGGGLGCLHGIYTLKDNTLDINDHYGH